MELHRPERTPVLLANFLIGLREGLEAAIIVGILVAYLVKLDERKHIAKITIGVVAAVAVSVGLGLVLSVVAASVPIGTEEAIAGVTSLVAVVFVSWMIFWMARTSRTLSTTLRAQIDKAVGVGSWSLAAVAFLAVIREGIETSVFLWSASKGAGGGSLPIVGALAGLMVAAGLGYLGYRGTVRLNLGTFFKFTGSFLILVAAGIFAYGVAELQEIGWIPLLTNHAYDLTAIIPEDGWLDSLLRGAVLYNGAPTVLQVLVWIGYVAITGWLFARENRKEN